MTQDEKSAMYHQAYLRASPEAIAKDRKRARKHYADHKEHYRERARQWKRNNPEIAKTSEEKRRAKKRGVESTLTSTQWKAVLEAYRHCCAYCGKYFARLSQDHVIPLSKGGKHAIENIVPACHSCNSKKHDGLPLKPVQTVLL